MKPLVIEQPTPAKALERITRDVALGRVPVIYAGGGHQASNVILSTDSMDYDLDLKSLWVDQSRWKLLTRQYVNGGAFKDWQQLITEHMANQKKTPQGVSFLRSSLVKSTRTGGRMTRKWGSCMIGWSFRLSPEPHFTMHSRATYLGYLAALDLGVAAHLAEVAGELTGIPLEDISFTWYIEQATFHYFRSMAWWFKSPNHEKMLKKSPSKIAHQARRMVERFERMDQEGKLYGDMAYAQERRYRMKWHTEVLGIDPTPYLGVGEKGKVLKNDPVPSNDLWSLDIVTGQGALEYNDDMEDEHE